MARKEMARSGFTEKAEKTSRKSVPRKSQGAAEMAAAKKRRSETEFAPRTALGKKLWAIRKKIVASGQPLLTWDEIEREVGKFDATV